MFGDEESSKAWDETQPEFEIMRIIAEGRKEADLTQRDINRLENGNANPALRTLKKLAAVLGCRLEIHFTKS